MKFSFPAIFIKEKDGGYSVEFPDIIACVTCGDDMEDAVYMAEDVLRLMLEDNANNAQKSKPSDINKLIKEYPNDIVKIIQVEIDDKYLVKK